jgi:hypothetical protein
MSALPQYGTFRVRSMHTRGIDRCISEGMSDLDEIARACGVPNKEILEDIMTKVQKMNIGRKKKEVAREMMEQAKKELGEG